MKALGTKLVQKNTKLRIVKPQEHNMKPRLNLNLGMASEAIATPSDNHPLDVFGAILDKLKPIDFRKMAQLGPRDQLTSTNEVVIIIRQIVKTAADLGLELCLAENRIYTFTGSFWHAVGGDEFQNFLSKASIRLGADEMSASHHRFQEQLTKQFRSVAVRSVPPSSPEKTLINLRNGTFEVTESGRSLRRPNASDFLRYQLPFSYLSEAKCPRWDRFLDEVLPDKATQNILAEYFAYVLTDLKLEQVLFLYGSGSNGKSVVFDVMHAIFGNENVTHYDLSQLSHETHLAMIAGKLLNYSTEVSRRFDFELFKKLVSREPVAARHLYGKPFSLNKYARLAFNCNQLPQHLERSEAFFRRMLVIHFQKVISKSKRDPNLAKTIIKNELPGVFNWLLSGLDRLQKNEEFSECKPADELLDEYKNNSDIVQQFLDEAGYEKVLEQKHGTMLQIMFDEYRAFCERAGEVMMSRRWLRSQLELKGFKAHKIGLGILVFAKR